MSSFFHFYFLYIVSFMYYFFLLTLLATFVDFYFLPSFQLKTTASPDSLLAGGIPSTSLQGRVRTNLPVIHLFLLSMRLNLCELLFPSVLFCLFIHFCKPLPFTLFLLGNLKLWILILINFNFNLFLDFSCSPVRQIPVLFFFNSNKFFKFCFTFHFFNSWFFLWPCTYIFWFYFRLFCFYLSMMYFVLFFIFSFMRHFSEIYPFNSS